MTNEQEEQGGAFPTFCALPRNLWRAFCWLWRKTWRFILGLLALLIVAHTIFNFIAGRRLEAELQKIRASGAPLTLTEAAPPQMPDAENAALLYLEAFKEMKAPPYAPEAVGGKAPPESELEPVYEFIAPSPRKPRPSLAEVAAIIDRHEKGFRLLEQASRRPACRFPVNWEAGAAALFPHLAAMRAATRFLVAKALVDAKRGRSAEAMKDLAIIIRMTNHISADPTLIAALARIACTAIMFRPLPEILSAAAPTEAESRALYDLLTEVDTRGPFVHAMQGERCFGLWGFDHVRKAGPKEFFGSEDYPHWSGILSRRWLWRILRPLWKPFLKLDEVFYLNYMQAQIALAAKPYAQSRQGYERLEKMLKQVPWYAILSRIMSPVFSRAHQKQEELSAMLGLMRAALALRAYQVENGAYPASLEELRARGGWPFPDDPFTGRPFIYRREGKGYLIYSVGADLSDDEGISLKEALAARRHPGPPPKNYDISLRMSR